jgi:hypothetical protein
MSTVLITISSARGWEPSNESRSRSVFPTVIRRSRRQIG